MNRDDFLYCELPQFESCTEELVQWFVPRIPKDLLHSPFTFFESETFEPYCPTFMSMCNQLDCELMAVVLYGIMPGRVQPENEVPHTDALDQQLALNFAIQNCEGTYTGMYEVIKGEQTYTALPNGVHYYKYDDDAEFNEIGRFDLSKPTIFNTHVPHRVVNPQQAPRISASLRFKKDPWHLTNNTNSVTINKKG